MNDNMKNCINCSSCLVEEDDDGYYLRYHNKHEAELINLSEMLGIPVKRRTTVGGWNRREFRWFIHYDPR